MQMPPRRSRMRRTRTGKRLELSERDIEIFKLLERYRFLRSTYIHAFVGGASEKRFTERLGDLYHEGYIGRPDQQWELARACHLPTVHESDAGATKALREAGIATGDVRTFPAPTAHRQFLHSLMICEVLASLDLDVRTDPQLRFIAWPQILARAPEQTRASGTPFRIPVPSGGYLVPDGLFGIEYRPGEKKAYRFFALEADRGTMPLSRSNGSQTSYLGKLAAYREILAHQIHKTHWGIPNLLVLTVTVGTGRVQEILDRLQDRSIESASFLFKALSVPDLLTAPIPQLLFEPWQRAGSPPLRIGESH
ncbi:MAG TPA: replication-relaxation family protein [Rhizomicrobium sp.]|nr:replication-relaxation family protein [Rhizomicrobium sp.]